jgi:protein phosphatase
VPRREYLRIIYGPEYTRPENLRTWSGCARERAGPGRREAVAGAARVRAGRRGELERFVRASRCGRVVHECVFGVLALESEPVDPRT